MEIKSLTISGFRGVSSGTIHFNNQCVIIGPNNSGKTTIIEALALLLGRERMIRTYTEHDFFGSEPSRETRFRIIGTFGNFPTNDSENHPEWFGPSRGIPKWMSEDDRTLSPEPTESHKHLVVQIAVDGRFDLDDLEVETVRYFYDHEEAGDPFLDEAVTKVNQTLLRQVGFFLVSANRTWDRMISFGSDLFKQVVNYVGGRPSKAVIDARDNLRNPENPLEEDDALADVIERIEKELGYYFTDDRKLHLRITPTDSLGVLEAVVPHYSKDGSTPLPSRREGSGLISLQTLALLLQFGHLRIENDENFILALEEPEIHVPPPLQKRIVRGLNTLTTQSVVTTHSPTVATYYNPENLILVRREKGQLIASPVITGPLLAEAPNAIRKLLNDDRDHLVEALMHRSVLIPEGKIDFYLFSGLSKIADKYFIESTEVDDLFSSSVGVIPTHDSAIVVTHDLLSNSHDSTHCLVDGDSAGDEYIKYLLSNNQPPQSILRWQDGEMIEDLFVHILKKDPSVLTSDNLNDYCDTDDPDEFGELLKTTTNDGGLKQNFLAYDALLSALEASLECKKYISVFLTDLVNVLDGAKNESMYFIRDTENSTDVTTVWKANLNQ